MSEQDVISTLILGVARKVLLELQQRCSEALKAVDQGDYLVVLGALTGVENEIRFLCTRLMVLRELKEIQKQKLQERRNK